MSAGRQAGRRDQTRPRPRPAADPGAAGHAEHSPRRRADERHDLPRLATLLASADADLVCLQEVDRRYGSRSDDVDQALLLSRALDMQLAWGPAVDERGREDDGGGGNVLLRGCRSWSATCTGCPAAASRASPCGPWSSSTVPRCG